MNKKQTTNDQQNKKGCGCSSIPLSLIIVLCGGGYFLFTQRAKIAEALGVDIPQMAEILPSDIQEKIPFLNAEKTPQTPVTTPQTPVKTPQNTISPNPPSPTPTPSVTPTPTPSTKDPVTPWDKKAIRGIYLSRYNATNNANEETIRARVRYYKKQGINTIIHGVWGNACTMYNSQVMQKTFGLQSCPNEFQDQWLDWLIDEAHKQNMEVHAYFEKGIKIDKDSPLFELAIKQGWIVEGIDKTHAGIDHYVLDVSKPEVSDYFTKILVEFVKKYPEIDAVQWDDYLGYHAELPSNVDRTASLTQFVQRMITEMKKANPAVSFDICHHNPYWSKRYFAADWKNWDIDRAFIQVYNQDNFKEELKYVEASDGIAITERQFNQLKPIMGNPKIKGILLFPLEQDPEKMVKNATNLIAN